MSTWVFLRGLTREARHWGAFPDVFRTEVADANVAALDLPGNGRLHGVASPTRIEDMVGHCRRELQACGHSPPYHLLALSLGAMVALAWAAQHPEELAACVLINTSLRPFSPFYRRLRPRSYLDLLRLALSGGDAHRRERLILRLTSARPDAHAAVVDAWSGYRRECPVSRRNALRQLIAAARYRAPARKPAVPILLLAGLEDRLVDARCSRRLAERWQTELTLHPSAGHDLPLDDGPWVARQVSEWLRRGVINA